MRKALLFLLAFASLGLAYFGRFQPISLELSKPSVKEAEIKGEIQNPGIYTLKWEDTVQDLIDAAGGLTKDADTSSISLLKKTDPDEVIVIPSLQNTKSLISINNASLEELCTLSGIGPSMAQRILDYRVQKPFSTLEEIMEVKGIGPKVFEKIKDHISL